MFAASSPLKRGAVRLAVGAAVSSLFTTGMVVAGAGAAAAAEEPQDHGGAAATLSGLKLSGDAVVRVGGEERRLRAGLFELAVDGGGTLRTYGVDLDMATQWDARYQETPWSGTSLGVNAAAGKIRWILQNSYPQVNDLAALARRAGAKGLTEQDAAVGTQVAIWRYSDGAGARPSARSKKNGAERDAREVPKVTAADPQAERLADYLEREARSLPEPGASLDLTPAAHSALLASAGEDGARIGPVKVRSGAERVTVAPNTLALVDGMRVLNAKGKPVTAARHGDSLFLDIPKGASAGLAALTIQTSTTVPVGRAFTSGSRSQTQVLAGSSESTVSATALVNWGESGPVPAVSAEKVCAHGGLEVMVRNAGDQDFEFELSGARRVVAAGRVEKVPVPLAEDQSYDFTVAGPDGYEKRISGIFDCRTRSSEARGTRAMAAPSPASAPGAPGKGARSASDLAATGGSPVTPVIAGTAVALVLVGGAAVLVLRTRNSRQQG
ncbi:TQXA domain-containing protein [Streptomyces sp. NPDC059578]|uniref:TQXA domain-containing protein n=1 Tax=Streptomyces sp. NPDC059578 TaxID=3346874 RepID=UPI0036868586